MMCFCASITSATTGSNCRVTPANSTTSASVTVFAHSALWPTAISIALQYGVPLETLVRKFSYMRFDPEGITGNPEIPFAKSMPDYIMRWLASRFLSTDAQEELGILTPEVRARTGYGDITIHRSSGNQPARNS